MPIRLLGLSRGPKGYDTTLAKNFAFTETLRLQFRSEFFNLTNCVNLSQPDVNFLSGNFGWITSAGDPRRDQFVLISTS